MKPSEPSTPRALLDTQVLLRGAAAKCLECAVTGDAHYLVSADADLLSLDRVQGIPIIPPLTFWERLRAEPQDSPEEVR